MAQQQGSEAREVRTTTWWRFPGWQMVGAAAIHGFTGYGFWLYGWSIFVSSLRSTFAFTAAEIGLGATVSRLDGGIEGIYTGWALDKWGPRFTAISGFIWCSIGWAGIASLDLIDGAWGHAGAVVGLVVFYGLFIVNAQGIALYTTSFPSINRWFVRRRTNAMGVVTIGSGTGATFLVPITALMVTQWGYVTAAWAFVAVNMLILAPLCVFFPPHPPEHYGYLPDNSRTETAQTRIRLDRAIESSVVLRDFTLGESFRTRAFWLYCFATAVPTYGVQLTLFQNIRMQAVGYSTQAAANFYSFQFVMTLVGRVSMTFFGELFDPYHGMWITRALMAVGLYFFAIGTQDWHFYAWAIIYGIPYGAWTPMIGTWRGSYYGRANIGKVYGMIQAISGSMGIPAGVVTGWMIDVWGIDTAFLIGAGLTVVATILYILATRPGNQPSPGAIKRAAKEAEEAARRS